MNTTTVDGAKLGSGIMHGSMLGPILFAMVLTKPCSGTIVWLIGSLSCRGSHQRYQARLTLLKVVLIFVRKWKNIGIYIFHHFLTLTQNTYDVDKISAVDKPKFMGRPPDWVAQIISWSPELFWLTIKRHFLKHDAMTWRCFPHHWPFVKRIHHTQRASDTVL